MYLDVPSFGGIYGWSYFENDDLVQGFTDLMLSWIFPLLEIIGFWLYRQATPGKIINKEEIKMDWYLTVLKKDAVFSGRARRKEYWMFFLFNLIFSLVLGAIDGLLGTVFIGTIYGLAVLIPGIAVSVRRLHDIGRTGWWVLISFIPLIGLIVLIIFAATEGDKGTNEYGSDPKEADGSIA